MFSRNSNFRLYPIGKKEASYSWRLKLAALHFENILCLKFGVWIKEEEGTRRWVGRSLQQPRQVMAKSQTEIEREEDTDTGKCKGNKSRVC